MFCGWKACNFGPADNAVVTCEIK